MFVYIAICVRLTYVLHESSVSVFIKMENGDSGDQITTASPKANIEYKPFRFLENFKQAVITSERSHSSLILVPKSGGEDDTPRKIAEMISETKSDIKSPEIEIDTPKQIAKKIFGDETENIQREESKKWFITRFLFPKLVHNWSCLNEDIIVAYVASRKESKKIKSNINFELDPKTQKKIKIDGKWLHAFRKDDLFPVLFRIRTKKITNENVFDPQNAEENLSPFVLWWVVGKYFQSSNIPTPIYSSLIYHGKMKVLDHSINFLLSPFPLN